MEQSRIEEMRELYKSLKKPESLENTFDEIRNYIKNVEERKDYAYSLLNKYKKEDSIAELEEKMESISKHSLYELSDIEAESNRKFRKKHYEKCKNGGAYWYKLTATGIGTAITIKCDKCGEELNISDYEW
jgi:DNA-directed RNA polymerase subunit M/transcription elongation factor TFIIS